MAVASWMLPKRSFRGRRYYRGGRAEDEVRVDPAKDARDSLVEMAEGACSRDTMSEGRRLNYLNALAKLAGAASPADRRDLLCCLRSALANNESSGVRAGALRAARHLVRDAGDAAALVELRYPALTARSLDVVLRNETERIQALRLMRAATSAAPDLAHAATARSLVSLANGACEDKDRLLRACLAALCELSVLNPALFVRCGGVAAVTRNVLDCQTPRIAECLCGALLHLLQRPETRAAAGVDLRCLAAPYCDFRSRPGWMGDERETRFTCSRLALLSVLRSWPGMTHLCGGGGGGSGGLRSLVDALRLNRLEVRRAVLDLLYELFGLPQPEWTDELSVALAAVDPSDPQDGWRLAEGFVAEEARCVLPHRGRTTPDLAELHLAVLLYAFLSAGLADALVEVIVAPDTFLSVRATVLLAELLHLVPRLLPAECSAGMASLRTLVEHASSSSAVRRQRAVSAVTALDQLHRLLQRRPAASSLYLEHVVSSARRFPSHHRMASSSSSSSSSSSILAATGVLRSREGFSWNWDAITAALRRPESLGDAEAAPRREFLRRLVNHFRPSSNRYSHCDLSAGRAPTVAGCALVRRLLAPGVGVGIGGGGDDDDFRLRLARELFEDVAAHVAAVTASRSAHDCLFSPQHMASTMCQNYFLLLGHAAHSAAGVRLLSDLGLFDALASLAASTDHGCYVKLIVSAFGYETDGPPRRLLAAVLGARREQARLYAVRFSLALLRARTPRFLDWAAAPLLARARDDASAAVREAALAVLQEACDQAPQSVLPLLRERATREALGGPSAGARSRLLLARLGSSSPDEDAAAAAAAALEDWSARDTDRAYVRVVEAELADALTLHQRDRRHAAQRRPRPDALHVPPHLYGQLAQHDVGLDALRRSGVLSRLALALTDSGSDSLRTDADALDLKAALWAAAHVAASPRGLDALLAVDGDAVARLTALATACPVYGVRGTALYALSLVATTRPGADLLYSLGWACVRHDRHDRWPVLEAEAERERDSDDATTTTTMTIDSPSSSSAHGDDLRLPEIDDDDDVVVDVVDDDDERRPHERVRCSTLPIGSVPPLPPPPPLLQATRPRHRRSASESAPVSPPPSHRDLAGYAALRELRRRRRDSAASEDPFGGPFGGRTRHRRPVPGPDGRCYMGVALPRDVSLLFPPDDDDDVEATDEDVVSLEPPSADDDDAHRCLAEGCSRPDPRDDPVKADALRHAERLANPVWAKQSKQALLHLKQRHSTAFRDECLYAEVCSMLASLSYRLSARRFLQELFLDLPFDGLHEETSLALRRLRRPQTSHAAHPAPTTTTTTLDGLRLSCSENKFPITTADKRPSVRSSVRSTSLRALRD